MYRPEGLDLWMYLRKSRKDMDEEQKALEEGRPFDTLERHRNRLMEVVKHERHNIIGIMEEVVSGEFISERPKMQELLHELENENGDGVLVIDLDRLGRGDMVDQGMIYRVFKYSDSVIVTPSEVINFHDGSAETLFSVRSLVAREELRMITKRLQDGRRDSASEGKSITNKVPYGYKRDENLRLYPDPDTAWVVEKIFNLIANGKGRRETALELDQDKQEIKPPNGKNWESTTISYMIRNEVYLGHIIWGKVKHTKINGKYRRKSLPPEKWKRKNNAHPAIVSQELFDRANEAMNSRYRTPKVKTVGLKNPLAGIVKCARCGRNMKYQIAYGGRRDRFLCPISCIKTAAFENVERALLSGLDEIIKQYESDAKPEKTTSVIPIKQKALEKKQKELDELHTQKGNLHDLLEKGVYDIDTFMERQKNVSARIKETSANIEQIQEDIDEEKEREQLQDQFVPKMKTVVSAYHQTTSIEKKNHLLKSILEKATFYRARDWNKPDQFELQLYPKL